MDAYDGGLNLLAKYVQGPGIDQPLAITTPAGTGYYEADALGSITTISGVQGNGAPALLNSYRYDSFGNTAATTGTFPNTIQYTGREWDSDTGLYFYRARYYDPTLGRFLSEDPLRFGSGQTNFYEYVGNNPGNFTDPFGLCATNPAAITCDTKLPNGQTVGDVVRQQRAILQSRVKQALDSLQPTAAMGHAADPYVQQFDAFLTIALPHGPIDFKNNFPGVGDSVKAVLGFAGNFAYYAIGSGIISENALDAGAGLYGILSSLNPFNNFVHFRDLTGHYFSDNAARIEKSPGLDANGCAR